MKATTLSLIFFIHSLYGYSQNPGRVHTLKGYFIVTCFDSTIKSRCGLDVKSSRSITGESMTCGDGSYYKNISVIKYISPADLDLTRIDSFRYQARIQADEHYVYLSVNPLILVEAAKGDSSILHNAKLVRRIRRNQKTAEQIQEQIEQLNLDFKKRIFYDVLMEVSVKVTDLPERVRPKTFHDNGGLDQYVILHHRSNKIKAVKYLPLLL
jgi:hypothetical protein